jgi:hypothetical protein
MPRFEYLFEGEAMTMREVQIARHGFHEGVRFVERSMNSRTPDHTVMREVAARFPLPKVRRPVRVTLSGGAIVSLRPTGENWDGQASAQPLAVWSTTRCGGGYAAASVEELRDQISTFADVLAIARVIQGETEEVEAE